MSATISGVDDHTPTLFLLYSTARQSGNTVDRLINGDAALQLGPATARNGRFAALFTDLDDAVALEAELGLAQVLTLVETDRPQLDMDFVVDQDGEVRVDIEEQTRDLWTVSWVFYEVIS